MSHNVCYVQCAYFNLFFSSFITIINPIILLTSNGKCNIPIHQYIGFIKKKVIRFIKPKYIPTNEIILSNVKFIVL